MANDETSLALDRGRRKFLNWFLSTTAGAFFISVAYPLSRYLIPPVVEESTAGTVTLSIKPNDLKANTGQIFRFGSVPAKPAESGGWRKDCSSRLPGLTYADQEDLK